MVSGRPRHTGASTLIEGKILRIRVKNCLESCLVNVEFAGNAHYKRSFSVTEFFEVTKISTTLSGSTSFEGGDTITVPRSGSFNEIQSLTLGGANAGSSFTLALDDTDNGINLPAQAITVGDDDEATAANLPSALNTALGAGGAVVVQDRVVLARRSRLGCPVRACPVRAGRACLRRIRLGR